MQPIDPLTPNVFIGIPLMALAVYLLSLGSVLLLMRLPARQEDRGMSGERFVRE